MRLRIFQLTLCISKIATEDAALRIRFQDNLPFQPKYRREIPPFFKASPAVHSLAWVGQRDTYIRLPAKHTSESRPHTQINHSIVSSQHLATIELPTAIAAAFEFLLEH